MLPKAYCIDLSDEPIVKDLAQFYDGRDYVEHLRQRLSPAAAQQVEITGAIPRADLVRHFKECDVYLMPSIYPEGFGIPIVEAAACRVPTVCTHRGGMPEVVEDGKTGLIVRRRMRSRWRARSCACSTTSRCAGRWARLRGRRRAILHVGPRRRNAAGGISSVARRRTGKRDRDSRHGCRRWRYRGASAGSCRHARICTCSIVIIPSRTADSSHGRIDLIFGSTSTISITIGRSLEARAVRLCARPSWRRSPRSAQDGRAAESQLACPLHDRLVQWLAALAVGFADEDAQQHAGLVDRHVRTRFDEWHGRKRLIESAPRLRLVGWSCLRLAVHHYGREFERNHSPGHQLRQRWARTKCVIRSAASTISTTTGT